LKEEIPNMFFFVHRNLFLSHFKNPASSSQIAIIIATKMALRTLLETILTQKAVFDV